MKTNMKTNVSLQMKREYLKMKSDSVFAKVSTIAIICILVGLFLMLYQVVSETTCLAFIGLLSIFLLAFRALKKLYNMLHDTNDFIVDVCTKDEIIEALDSDIKELTEREDKEENEYTKLKIQKKILNKQREKYRHDFERNIYSL